MWNLIILWFLRNRVTAPPYWWSYSWSVAIWIRSSFVCFWNKNPVKLMLVSIKVINTLLGLIAMKNKKQNKNKTRQNKTILKNDISVPMIDWNHVCFCASAIPFLFIVILCCVRSKYAKDKAKRYQCWVTYLLQFILLMVVESNFQPTA